jgi:putative tricarboxylic transport membrane protein
MNGEGGLAAVPPQRPARPYWIGLLLIVMGGIWLYGAAGLPQGARYAAVGPGLSVTVSGLGLVILGVILIVQIVRGERFDPQDEEDAAANAPMDRAAFLTALAAAGLPILTMRTLGVPATATLCFALVARAFGSRRTLLDLVIGGILASVAWFLFTRLGLQLGRFFPLLGF